MNLSLKTISLLATVAFFSGCASITTDSHHPIKLETKTADGKMVVGANCKLTNDYETAEVKSGDEVRVRRSSVDLVIKCTHPENPDANALATSRANAGLMGNIIIGGGIGAMIDHSSGKGYTYPGWLQLVFGQSLVFDRKAEEAGKPVAPTSPEAPK